ncbi:unnamed protein product [Symbiodinium sp. CCMP2592]|nr:unnamed protein product [Symbiodinium sp. CCMP2592]CAE7639471.1 unnamed protein product [Symbiodinium sp. CCMP2592]
MSALDRDELRLSRTRFPGVIQLGKVEHIDAETISKLVTSVGYRLDFVLLAAASPCTSLSKNDASLFFDINRIYSLLRDSFAVPVHLMVENLANIPPDDIRSFNEALDLKPYLVDSKYFTWVRRPRLFWVTWGISLMPGETLVDHELFFEWVFPDVRGDKEAWVDEVSSWHVVRLVPHFLRIAEKSGTDVPLDAGIPFRAKAWPRTGIQSQLFKWATVHCSRICMSFLTYLADANLVAGQANQLCEAAASWVEFLYADGQRKGLASDGLAGLQYFLPECQGHLKLSWKLVKVWQRIEPPMRVLPLSPLLVLGMAGLAACLALPDIAAGLLICFDGILRSGELYQLRVGDITFYTSRAALRLGLTKAGKRTGQEEMVVINRQIAVKWLHRACVGMSDDELLLRRGPDFFRECFKLFINEFDLAELKINVYSLRRGGATWDFLAYQSMERTLLRCRWASTSSARVYLQDAVATIAHLKLARPIVQRHFFRRLKPGRNREGWLRSLFPSGTPVSCRSDVQLLS